MVLRSIPKPARERFGLTGGQRLIVLSDDNEGIALVRAEVFEERMKKAMKRAIMVARILY